MVIPVIETARMMINVPGFRVTATHQLWGLVQAGSTPVTPIMQDDRMPQFRVLSSRQTKIVYYFMCGKLLECTFE